jgi:hypothetical protein
MKHPDCSGPASECRITVQNITRGPYTRVFDGDGNLMPFVEPEWQYLCHICHRSWVSAEGPFRLSTSDAA